MAAHSKEEVLFLSLNLALEGGEYWKEPLHMQQQTLCMDTQPIEYCFWKRYDTAWPFICQPKSGHAVLTAAMYSVMELSYQLCDYHGAFTASKFDAPDRLFLPAT
jgi:hypothetical protein